MLNKIQARTPLLALILFVFAVGYTVAAKVVVIPLGADAAPALPSGMVSSFNREACPTGWTKYTNAQGRFVVGLNDGGSLGYTHDTPLAERDSRWHDHAWAWFDFELKDWWTLDTFGRDFKITNWADGMDSEGAGFYPLANQSTGNFGRESYRTDKGYHTPPYVQLLYCEKV